MNRSRLTLSHQRGTHLINGLYRVRYLQWTGIKSLDRVFDMFGLALLLILAMAGLGARTLNEIEWPVIWEYFDRISGKMVDTGEEVTYNPPRPKTAGSGAYGCNWCNRSRRILLIN